MKKAGSLKAYLAKIAQGRAGVRVGVLENATYPDGTSVAHVATIHEYGAEIQVPEHTTTIYRTIKDNGEFNRNGRFVRKEKSNFATTHIVPAHTISIPARAPIRRTIAEHSGEWIKSIGDMVTKTRDIHRSLALLGEQIKGDMTETILTYTDPPNAPSTVKRKGFNAPLRDTSRLSRSISYEVLDQ
ncbi:hypothetical protein RMB03_17415 [Acinetobacter sp. V91_7]|uniref:hypothetical protein n=1 Tax=unclassified Acinetobacter TaxID=196816 RepID=UPI00287F02F9|nr:MULTISPECIES: hypothetical protein [unclassified Acinetobacter]MDS7935664.1 hypothetical protein [Acinetobacter sp. V91_4B]MDS7964728.1 hypothetical protein [Acinetobacter sp. V91_7]MDS8025577.1 hypothetical protein [Acinetobacter sp. V91_13]